MDSFYDLPRSALVTTTTFEKCPPLPTVSDVSLCVGNEKDMEASSELLLQNGRPGPKKQVRFESPLKRRLSAKCNDMLSGNRKLIHSNIAICEQNAETVSKSDSLVNNFQHIYLANIPNRQVDLSVIDSPKCDNDIKYPTRADTFSLLQASNNVKVDHRDKENVTPLESYRNFVESWQKQKNIKELTEEGGITDIFNYHREKYIQQSCPIQSETALKDVGINVSISSWNNNFSQKSLVNRQLNNVTETNLSRSNNAQIQDPTTKDLLKIIAQQNEQILNLQKQLAVILSKQQQLTSAIPEFAFKKTNPSTNKNADPTKATVSKLSVGLMTSFEVELKQSNKSLSCQPCYKSENYMEKLISLEEPVRETCPSPDPSMNIKMQDYDTSDKEETITESNYKTVLQQVNNLLGKAHLDSDREVSNNGRALRKKNSAIDNVKAAINKQLEYFGITVKNTDVDQIFGPLSRNEDYNPSEISFAVNQLLMKYLPNGQFARKPSPEQTKHVPIRKKFSFASVQHMKKYDLLPLVNQSRTEYDPVNIIDRDALIQQPKLL